MKEFRVAVFVREASTQRALESVLDEDSVLDVVASGGDGGSALASLQTLRPDLAILDVRLPGRGGFEIVEAIAPEKRPAVIFTSEAAQDAARAFDVGAVDYLVMPLRAARLRSALERAKDCIRNRDMNDLETRLWRLLKHALAEGGNRIAGATAWPARISLKVEGDYHFVGVRDILWVEAQRDLVKVCATGGVHFVRESLQQFERRLDPTRFSRVHRSFIVNFEHVVRISAGRGGEATLWMSDGTKVPASRSSRPNLEALIGREPDQILEFARAFEIREKDNNASPPR